MLRTNLDKTKPFANTSHNKWHKLFWLAIVMMLLTPRAAFATLVNNGVDGTIGWDAIISNGTIIAGATTGQTPGGLISVTNHLSSGFDIYAKNNSDPSSQNFTMRNQLMGITGATSAPFVRILAVNGYTPEWLELRANQGIFDLTSIKVGSNDGTVGTPYDFTLQALDSSFSPTGAAVTLNGVENPNYGTFNVSNNTDFDGIYGVRITVNTGRQIAVDDIEITNPRMPDTTPPTVTSITSSTSDGTYKVGAPISIQVNFSENVIVASGTPQLTLETGTTDRTINYTSGTGSSTLTFTYSVQAGDITADLDYTTINALALNGSTIRDAAGNNAILTLATPGTANSLGNNKALVIDGVVPTVTSVNSVTANGTYKIGDVISVQVNFSEAVTVTGTPQLTLETGATDRTISYATSTGPSTLSFSYTVQAGDNSNDLDYVATTSLALGGGTIRDDAANNATLTLATPGQPGSLGANKNFVIDGVVPSVTSTAPVGGALSTDTSVDFTVNFSETVSNISTDDFALGVTGSATGTIASVSASSGTTVNVTVSDITGNGTIKLNVNAWTNIADAAGNSGLAAYTSGTTHTVAIPTPPDAPTIGTATAGDAQATVTFTAPGNNGGSAITGYTVTSNPGNITAGGNGFTTSPIVVTGLTNGTAYTFTMKATNAIGDSVVSGTSNSATPKGNQTITFTQPSDYNFGTTPTLSATASSGLDVDFSSTTTGVCTITSGGELTFVTAGSCTIEADQAGNTIWNAATTVPQTFTVNAVVPGAPTIGMATAGDTQATVTFTAPASTGGAAIIASGYTVTANPGGATATGSSSPITVTGLTNGLAYTFTVTATNSAGEGNPSAASNSIIPAAPQAITFGHPGTQNFGTTPTLTATSSAGGGYPVSFTSSTTGVCTITSGGTLTFVTTGSCTINANQAGDSSYLAAPQVSQTFTVNAVVPSAPIIGTATAGDGEATVTFDAPANMGGSALVHSGYTVTANPGGITEIRSSSPVTVTGLTNGVSYTFTVTATNSAGESAASDVSNAVTPGAAQTITFDNPGTQNLDSSLTLTASASSGLIPSFTSSSASICTVTSGGAVTFIAVGTCTISANQLGNSNYLAATPVTRSFTVDPRPNYAPTISGTPGTSTAQDVAYSFTPTTADQNSDPLTFSITNKPSWASFNTATGVLSGTPTNSHVGVTNGIVISVSDGILSTSLPTFSLTVVNVNDAPVIGGMPTTSVNQGVAYSFTPIASDVDVGTTLAFSIANQPAWANFDVATGVLSGTPTNADVGTTSGIEISVSDGSLSATLPAFDLSVANVNDAPVIGGTPSTTVNQDAAYSFTPAASDVDDNTTLTFSIVNKPTWASFDPTNGDLTGTPTNADVGTTSNIVITVTDGSLSTSLPAFNVTVINVNDAPTIVVSPPAFINQGELYDYTPSAVDGDADPLTFDAVNLPGWLSVDTATGRIYGTPGQDDVGTYPFGIFIRVTDGSDFVWSDEFSITVNNVNDAPVISGAPETSVNQGDTYSFTPSASDMDADALTYSITNKPTWVVFDEATGTLTGTPMNEDVGTTSGIVITVSDGSLSANLPAFDLSVVNVDDAPTLTGTPLTTVNQGVAYSFVPTGNDVDVGSILTYSITNKPTWASFSSVTGVLTGTPTNADVGTTTDIVISVTDGSLSASLPAFDLSVVNVNDAPVIGGTPTITVNQDVAYSFTPTASDVDVGSTLTFSITNKPSWAAFNPATGVLSGTPTNSHVGVTNGIVISVSDGIASVSLPTFNLTVVNVNDAPVIGGTPTTTVNQDVAYSFIPTASDSDVDDTLVYTITNKPDWASFDTATGALTGTPTNAHVGVTNAIVISVSDGTLSANLPAFNLTVVNVNDAPVISGTPTITVNQDVAYSFTPTASDVDVSSTLTYSITNKPTWASFNTATGALTGTPTNAHVGVTNAIVISVSDGTLSANLPAFNLTVVNVNDAPVISGTPTTTVNQDVAYSFIPTASDSDVDDTLVYSITNQPEWASFDTATGALTGTPVEANIGVTNDIVITVSDGTLSASLPAFNLTVENINDAPVISGTPVTSVNQDVAYSFIPTASDVDVGDTLVYTITNKPSWAIFNTTTGALTGTPTHDHVGITNGIVITVSDGTLSASLPAFTLEVVSTVDPLQPIVTAPADLDLNASALFTPITLRQLLGMNSSATQAEIDQVLKAMASDGVSGNSCCTANPEGLNANNSLLLAPGRHEVKWKATNAMGVTGEATQVINLKPLISLSKSQIALRGSAVSFSVILNGRSPTYPLSVPYVIDASTSATSAEHNLINGVASFTQEGQVEVVIPVSLNAVSGVSDSQLVIALGDGINAGAANRHTISIREGNIPPVVNMVIRQGGVATSLITPNGGAVTVSVDVRDANPGDTHTFDWSATSGLADTDGNPVNASRVFDPAGLSGSHQVQVIVMDSAGAAVQAQAYFRVIASLPILSADTDTDKDGSNDDLEGSGDSDNNGIPDYLDNMPSPNILPQTGNVTNAYLIECDPGVRCGLGLFARESMSGGAQILDSEINQLNNLIVDPAFKPVGGVFDFVIRDLPTPGQSVRVVIPQQAPIPENPVYRKFQKGQWVNFISNTDNAIHSTAGNAGYCPPPGSAEWQLGLTPGHLCVQLTLQDGGPNDDDGQVNSAVVDPGAVSTALPVDPPIDPPVQPPMDVEVKAKRGGAMGEIWLLALAGLLLLRRANAKLGHRF